MGEVIGSRYAIQFLEYVALVQMWFAEMADCLKQALVGLVKIRVRCILSVVA